MPTKKVKKPKLPIRIAILRGKKIQGNLVDFFALTSDLRQLLHLQRSELETYCKKLYKNLVNYLLNRGLNIDDLGSATLIDFLEKEIQDEISMHFFHIRGSEMTKKLMSEDNDEKDE